MRRALLCVCLLAQPAWGQTGAIIGMVMDSVHGRPLVGAAVLVDGSALQALTDSNGQFRIDAVPAGSQRVTVHHPMLDSLELGLGSVAFTVPANAAIRVALATPSAPTLLARVCTAEGTSTLLLGRVTRGESGEPVYGAGVRASWEEAGQQVQMSLGMTDRTGRYHLCVPSGPAILLHGQSLTEAAGYVPPATGTRDLAFTDIRLPTIGDTADVALSGRIVTENGLAVRGASIAFLGRSATTTSGDDGQFHLKGLPAGTQVIIVRSVGLSASILPIDLSTRAPQTITVTMHQPPPTLTTIDIVADRQRLTATYQRVGFTERQKLGFGTFITEDQIANHAGVTTADVLTGYQRVYGGDNGDHGVNGAQVDAKYGPYQQSHVCTLFVVDGQCWARRAGRSPRPRR
jgi:carboxypeptidase family protein